jgi:hypothetical protein
MAKRNPPPGPASLVKLDWNTFQLICERLEETGARYKSCEDLGFNYATVRDAIASATAHEDHEWQALWDLSCAKHAERIEQELLRRGVHGVVKKVWGRVDKDQDGEIGEEVHYSDTLLLAANKAYNERYRDRAPVMLGAGLEVPDIFAQLTPEARKKVRDIIVMDLAEQAAIHGRSEEVLETERQGVKLLKPPPEPEAKKAARKKKGES